MKTHLFNVGAATMSLPCTGVLRCLKQLDKFEFLLTYVFCYIMMFLVKKEWIRGESGYECFLYRP